MLIQKKSKVISFIALYSSTTLALLPVLSPYEFFGPFLASHLMLFSAYALSVLVLKKLYIIPSLLFLLFSHVLLSLLAYTIRVNDLFSEGMISSLLYTSINVIIIMQLIKLANKKIFFSVASMIGVVASIFLIIQFGLMTIGINPPDGKIPGLPLNETQGWAAIDINNQYLRRVHSFFSEPSYFAIYILPLLAIALRENKKLKVILFFVALFLSTSSLGIIGSVIIVVCHLFIVQRKLLRGLAILGISLLIYLVFKIDFSQYSLFSYNLEKIINLGSNSQLRLTGYIDYYFLLPEVLQMIGVGYNQISYYFMEYGLKNYSNAFVISLMNFGFVGLLTYILFIIKRLHVAYKYPLFVIIFIVVSSIDAFLYNMFFFYILAFVYLNEENRKIYQDTNSNFHRGVKKLQEYPREVNSTKQVVKAK